MLQVLLPDLWLGAKCMVEIPRNGKVVDTETGLVTNLHAIYGGVELLAFQRHMRVSEIIGIPDWGPSHKGVLLLGSVFGDPHFRFLNSELPRFGLDRFELAQRRPGIPVPGMAMQQAAMQGMPGMQLGPSGRPMFMPQRFQLSQRGEMPQGVDLNLDQFNLTEVEQFAGSLPACSADAKSLEARVTLGRAFLEGLRSGFGKEVSEENQELLKGIFNLSLADRTEEADAFIPPDPNNSYISKVRSLVGDEQALLKKRKGAFCDKSFTPGSCGPEFPRSWTSRFTMENPSSRAGNL